MSCQPPRDRDPFDATNDPGIDAPSETAKPLMGTEGFVQDGDAQSESVSSRDTLDHDPHEPMYHADEFNRVVPRQRKWTL